MSDRPRCPAGTGELAGFGTDHPGTGLCHHHGGSTPLRKRECMDTEQRQKLADHIHTLWDHGMRLHQEADRPTEFVAHGIADDPQAHIDALVKAGLLYEEQSNFIAARTGSYRIVPPEPPHEHKWVWYEVATSSGTLAVSCLGCGVGLPEAIELLRGRPYTGPVPKETTNAAR